MLVLRIVLWVMPAVCLPYLWTASPGPMPPALQVHRPSSSDSRSAMGFGQVGSRAWQQGMKVDRAFGRCSLCSRAWTGAKVFL